MVANDDGSGELNLYCGNAVLLPSVSDPFHQLRLHRRKDWWFSYHVASFPLAPFVDIMAMCWTQEMLPALPSP